MLAEVDSAGRVTLFPGTTFLHINGTLVISSGAGSAHLTYLKAEYNQWKQELSLIYENKGKGSIVCSKQDWSNRVKTNQIFFQSGKKKLQP